MILHESPRCVVGMPTYVQIVTTTLEQARHRHLETRVRYMADGSVANHLVLVVGLH